MKTLSYEEFDAFESAIDTEYFGIASAKVFLKKACSLAQEQTHLLEFMQDFEFVSITNKSNDPINNRWLGEKTTAFLTDMNIQLRKKVSISENHNNNLATVEDNFPENDQIIRIAKTSFTTSQFLSDPYLPLEKAQYIYADITKNAFGKDKRFFVVTRAMEVITGFLLFSIDEETSYSTIELIAIDQDFQGTGIGRSLMRSMENYVSQKKVESIKVGTQLNNTDALNFYTSFGFKYFECNSIYHYWPSKQ